MREDREGGHFRWGIWTLRFAGTAMDILNKALEMESHNNLPPQEVGYLLGPIS